MARRYSYRTYTRKPRIKTSSSYIRKGRSLRLSRKQAEALANTPFAISITFFTLGLLFLFLNSISEYLFVVILAVMFFIVAMIAFVYDIERLKKNREQEEKLKQAILNTGIEQVDELSPFEFES